MPSPTEDRTLVDSITAVPGTEFLYDLSSESADVSGEFEGYQHLRKGDGHILLVPQPSTSDLNDPLKWSALRKVATFVNALSYAFLGGVTGPIMAACRYGPVRRDHS